MRMSDEERKAQAFFHRLSLQLINLEWQFGVRISGFLGDAVSEQMEAVARWLNDCETAARATAQDGISRQIPGPNKGQVDIVRPTEAMEGESWGLTGTRLRKIPGVALLPGFETKTGRSQGVLSRFGYASMIMLGCGTSHRFKV